MQNIKINISQITTTIMQLQGNNNDSAQESDERMMAKIRAKVKRGKKLSSKEETYLKTHDPELYLQYMRIRKMTKCLENQLKNANSKEEVNDIIYQFMNSVPDKDPYKDAIINALEEVVKEFKNSDAFQKLPATSDDVVEQENALGEDSATDNQEDTFDPMSWTPLQDVIDAMPTFDASS